MSGIRKALRSICLIHTLPVGQNQEILINHTLSTPHCLDMSTVFTRKDNDRHWSYRINDSLTNFLDQISL